MTLDEDGYSILVDGVEANLLTNKLTPWFDLVDLIDVALACGDANSKLVEVVTVADVDDENRVGNSFLQIWNMRFGHKAKLLFRLWAQGLVKILSLSIVEIVMFGWDFEIKRDSENEIWSRFV